MFVVISKRVIASTWLPMGTIFDILCEVIHENISKLLFGILCILYINGASEELYSVR